MTTRIGRLAGAILVETEQSGQAAWFLVGDTKVPCDFGGAGFAEPEDRDARKVPYVRLRTTGAPRLTGTRFTLPLNGESAARALSERLLVSRNGSVSERLWRLVTGVTESDDELEDSADERALDARWLVEVPLNVWSIVRDNVLRCT
jgi:hypothetical protein